MDTRFIPATRWQSRMILAACAVVILWFAAHTGCRDGKIPLRLTQAEKQWLREHSGKITLAPCPDYPPIDFVDGDGRHTGLAADYIRIIEKNLDFRFVLTHQKDWHTVIGKAKNREVDAVCSIQKTPERTEYLLFSEPFVKIPNIIVVRDNVRRSLTLQQMREMKISLVRGYAVSDHIMAKYPRNTYMLEPNELTCLMKVSFHRSDAAVVTLSSASYYIEQKGITNLRVAGPVGYDWLLSFGIRKDMPLLNDAVNKVLTGIPAEEHDAIKRRWMGLGYNNLLIFKKFLIPLSIILIIIALIIIGILIWNRTLRREVNQRTEDLKRELARRKEAQLDLAAEKERLLVTLKWIGDGVISIDTGGRIVLFNRIAEELTGWNPAEASGAKIREVFIIKDRKTGRPCVIPEFGEQRSGTDSGTLMDAILVSRKGYERNILISTSAIRSEEDRILGAVLIFRDITERLKIEEELNRVQKLESLGILAGGIAHDFNNILTAILGNANLLEHHLLKHEELRGDEHINHILSEIERATLRARDLTFQLLTFSRGGKPVKEIGSIKKALSETSTFALRGTNLNAEFRIADNLWLVEFDEGQMSQVFNNLVINAQQSMPGGGTIVIYAENAEVAWEPAQNRAMGRYVKISIEDRGIGIPVENLHKIFDPYFTTKDKGSGLGLASAFSIVKQHEGYMDVESKVGEGSIFTVYLPAANAAAPASRMKEVNEIIRSTGTILIMDDEEQIRATLKKMLEYLGYRVISAKHGEEAISLYRDAEGKGEAIDAVILDLTIPGGMGGRDTVARLLRMNSGLRAIATSGYSQEYDIAQYREYGFMAFIPKPFRMEELSKTLYAALHE